MTARLFPFTSSKLVTGAIAAGLTVATVAVGLRDDASGWLAIGFAIMPDLTFLTGIGQPAQRGQMPPRAIPFYNAAHSLIGPVALLAGAAALGPNMSLIGAGLAWATHIMVDRSVGYGMRGRDGFQASAAR
ncbi:MAG: DUF4260 family protein [Thermomicrobiales bacterium]